MVPTKTELVDLFWRTLWTFLEAFLGFMVGLPIFTAIATGETVVFDTGDLRTWGMSATVAGVASTVSIIKTYVSNKLGTGTATSKITPAGGLPAPVASNIARPAD